MYCPFTGLGLYDGYRGDRWLKNRIKIFKQFVLPALLSQTNKNFTLWVSWRYQERTNLIVREFREFLAKIKDFKTVHTFDGVCFYDDKYENSEARSRLALSIHRSLGDLIDEIGDADTILMTIQPSDDCYDKFHVASVQNFFDEHSEFQAVGYTNGYICNYRTLELSEYNPTTNPPFYTIKFPREEFCEPLKHMAYTALKRDSGKYKAGTPCPSHEFIADCLNYATFEERGFLVGCHGENISTYYDHPFKGSLVDNLILNDFGLEGVKPLRISFSLRKWILKKLPHPLRKKLRYYNERTYNLIRK